MKQGGRGTLQISYTHARTLLGYQGVIPLNPIHIHNMACPARVEYGAGNASDYGGLPSKIYFTRLGYLPHTLEWLVHQISRYF
jgi:hypothetical protein